MSVKRAYVHCGTKNTRQTSSNRSAAKAAQEYAEVVDAGGSTERFTMQRFPIPSIERIEVLSVFDYITPDRPDVYSANEAILFGEKPWPSDEFKNAVVASSYEEAASLLCKLLPIPSREDVDKRYNINDSALLDYASRNGMSKDDALSLVHRHSCERFKPKDIVFEGGRISTMP